MASLCSVKGLRIFFSGLQVCPRHALHKCRRFMLRRGGHRLQKRLVWQSQHVFKPANVVNQKAHRPQVQAAVHVGTKQLAVAATAPVRRHALGEQRASLRSGD